MRFLWAFNHKTLIAALGKRYAGQIALDPSNEMPVLAAYASASEISSATWLRTKGC